MAEAAPPPPGAATAAAGAADTPEAVDKRAPGGGFGTGVTLGMSAPPTPPPPT
jgi:hypothetical protein